MAVDPSCVAVIELAERYADGKASEEELIDAWVEPSGNQSATGTVAHLVQYAVGAVVDPDAWNAALCAHLACLGLRRESESMNSSARVWQHEVRVQAELLRDLFGPKPGTVLVDLSWLGAAEEEVVRLAGAIYHERAFGDLPVLADALEDAGCPNPVLIDHCRHCGEHARGCWLVDALLGKI
jgi:hypothetical protein